MTPLALAGLMFGSLIVLLILGMPVSFILGGLATIFAVIFLGPQSLTLISSQVYGNMDNFVLIAIPLFIFMGNLLQNSSIAEEVFDMMYKWLGGIKGGLAVGTVIVCTIFAALTGAAATATVSMGLIALPAMLKRGYNKKLAIGCIAAGGTLGVLIPPSVLMVIYGLFASESIGKLFAGGVMAGMVMSALFCAYIIVASYVKKDLAPSIPKDERPTWKERFISLKGIIFPVLLIVGVLGSIFAGIATATEGASIGALGSLICIILKKQLNRKMLQECCVSTIRLTAMVVWIMFGSSAFAALFTSVGAVEAVRQMVTSLPVSPYLVLIFIMAILYVMGMFIDPGAIIMLTVPIFLPIAKTFGFDPTWFAILFIVNMMTGYVTPPFGFNLFYMKAVVPKGTTMGEIYIAVVPFVLLMIVTLVLCVIFPQIIMYVPNKLFPPL
ncbi:MAG: TRAP transporter large permease subunit [Dehalobacterium sp.]